MTPTASRLQVRLDDRRLWFINEWFFKWHFIKGERTVTIDSFDGRGIHYGGIKFDGTARLVYWQTIVRGVRKEIDAQFAWINGDVRNYNRDTALRAIDECAGLLTGFVNSIRGEAIKKDRILRGDGMNFPPEHDDGNWEGVSNGEVRARAKALKAALPEVVGNSLPVPPPNLRWRQRAARAWDNNKKWIEPIAIILTVVGLVLPFL